MRPGIGIIGTGMVGQMCHLANFVANPGCRVVAIADLRPDLATAAAQKFGISRVYGTHRELLADSEVSAVVVVTKRRATGPIVLDALNSGRHVLSEKPMAYTTVQAASLVEAARRQRLVYSIGYMKRHDAGVARALAELARLRTDGSLGCVVGARGWCFGGDTGRSHDNFVMTGETRPDGLELWQDGPDWMPSAMRPGYDNFLNVFSHIINLARYLLGSSPAVAESTVEIAGAARITLDFDGVACALDLVNGSEGAWREGLTIDFERGALTIELPPPFAEQEAEVILDQGGQRTRLVREGSWAFRRQADAFVADIVEQGTPLASGQDSVADIALAEAIWKRQVSG
ncbi:putative dehydrogenase [Bradyrhizobium japonicum]|uniref:Dehydrogenase n=2 Tax=Bradyrhizobium TaxID=374 RepID=A0A809Y1U8_9BRAD|nr:Gfo/Idh/MocA family oxidoreductase [Bradyrhizobium diazoefficiens]MBP1064393.1 putative dehydrogenase [Bradyrhizobium japonicum]WLA77378.1 Gfo/Idh/MocA family oxidoreductase [Bradyrhizobium diazoefficiens]BCA05211.1 dehydrogenase [Bradyrhizobium diazoefficiens]BCA22566.1 dehydrogenase [Bradyrhizobium diazoefficiens]BCE23232.1 dehydrogenase [Bradyrhizobium diazoefficiens]